MYKSHTDIPLLICWCVPSKGCGLVIDVRTCSQLVWPFATLLVQFGGCLVPIVSVFIKKNFFRSGGALFLKCHSVDGLFVSVSNSRRKTRQLYIAHVIRKVAHRVKMQHVKAKDNIKRWRNLSHSNAKKKGFKPFKSEIKSSLQKLRKECMVQEHCFGGMDYRNTGEDLHCNYEKDTVGHSVFIERKLCNVYPWFLSSGQLKATLYHWKIRRVIHQKECITNDHYKCGNPKEHSRSENNV